MLQDSAFYISINVTFTRSDGYTPSHHLLSSSSTLPSSSPLLPVAGEEGGGIGGVRGGRGGLTSPWEELAFADPAEEHPGRPISATWN